MTSLASLLVRLRGPRTDDPGPLPDLGVQARGWLYELLGSVAPGLAAAVHDAEGPKPFTCSGLLSSDGAALPQRGGPMAEGYALRLTALTESMAEALLGGLNDWQAAGRTVRLGPLTLAIEDVLTDAAQSPWAGMASYGALARSTPRTRWRLAFHSPTAFRQRHGHLPLPLPSSIFRSAFDRWNAFCPEPLPMGPEVLQAVEEAVFPSAVRIETQRVGLSAGAFVGFTGRVDLTAVRPLPPDLAATVTALAEYLHFCGCGHGTTRGWGRVGLLDGAARQPGRAREP